MNDEPERSERDRQALERYKSFVYNVDPMTHDEARVKLGLQPLEVYETTINNPTKEMAVGFTNEEFDVVVGVLNQGLWYVNPDGSPYDRIERMTEADREILSRFTRRMKTVWLNESITS